MKDVLILGSKGQVGCELYSLLKNSDQLSLVGLARHDFDFTDFEELRRNLSLLKPDYIINCAAYTAVDRAEVEVELAMLLNSELPQQLATISDDIGAKLVHFSTDYVFDGKKREPYLETDQTNPLSIYGVSKLAGEEQVLKTSKDSAAVLRTSWVHGQFGANFLSTISRLAIDRESLSIVSDQIGSPCWSGFLAETVSKLIDNFSPGLFHCTMAGYTSWYEYALFLTDELRARGVKLALNEITPQSSKEFQEAKKGQRVAFRPENSVLDSSKLEGVLGIRFADWRVGVRAHLDRIYAK